MFNIGPLELVVLVIIGVVVVGPDKLPNLARDAARMIRQLRDMATGAREQLRDELGPEFADVDLRNLNPRTALQRAILGDDVDLRRYDPRSFDARSAIRDAVWADDEPADQPSDGAPVSMSKSASGAAPRNAGSPAVAADRPRPRPRPGPNRRTEAVGGPTPFDGDAT